ncbi:aspartate/glutamate racemase family protein, partial [Flavobacteriaceae bacterium]|nr:aspartate/glutamate racemase family protein [Flavobacteriaceae bacterium]
MNVLYLNPVSFYKYNQIFADSLKEYKDSNTKLDVACFQPTSDLPISLDNLGYRVFESLVKKETAQVARLGSFPNLVKNKRYDAMVIGCFYDPEMFASRTISGSMYVVGPCQASCQVATNLGNKFSIIIGMDYWEDEMKNTVYEYGYKDHLISFESVNIPANEFSVDPEKTLKAIEAAALNAVNKGAEAIILGCTLEMGTFLEVQKFL